MLFDPLERNVYSFLFPARVRPMKELVLALTIHGKNVTMVKPARAAFIKRTGLTPPSEKCKGTKTHCDNEFGIPTLSKQRFVVAMPTNTRFPSPVKVQVRGGWPSPSAHQGCIRGAIALHTPASSGQHRFPVCGPIAGPCPYAYEQVHEESQGTAHAVRYDPFLSQSLAASRREKDSQQ